MLRNRMPDGAATRDDLTTVLRYVPVAQVHDGIAKAVAVGVLTGEPHGGFRFTDRGRAVIDDLYRLMNDIVAVLDVAAVTGGPAFAVMHPPYEPAGSPPSMVLAERLTPLRSTASMPTSSPGRPKGSPSSRSWPRRLARHGSASSRRPTGERLELLGGIGTLPN